MNPLKLFFLLWITWNVEGPIHSPEIQDYLEKQGIPLMETMAEQIQVNLPPSVTVVLLPGEGGNIPHWVAGYYTGGKLYLRVRRITDIPQVFAHELAHALLHAKVTNHPIPRWFDEGIAMHLAGETPPMTRSFVLAWKFPLRVEDITDTFPSKEPEVHEAYARAWWVTEILLKQGKFPLAQGLEELQRGRSLQTIIEEYTGKPLLFWIKKARTKLRWTYVFYPILTSTGLLWVFLAILTVIGYKRKRKALREYDDTDFSYHQDLPS